MQSAQAFLKGLTGTAPQPQAQSTQEGAGLLAEWTAYSGGEGGDIEAGSASTSGQQQAAAASISKNVEDVGNTISSFFRQSMQTVSEGIGSVQAPNFQNTFPNPQQLMLFFCLMGGGLVFLSLALFVFLPVIILAPAKFALCFSIGCMLVLSSFAALRGWKYQAQQMITRERLPFTAGYTASVLMTLYAALIMHSYILSLGCSGLQVVALVYYVTSMFPGGAQAAHYMMRLFYSAASGCFGTVRGMLG